MELHSQAERDLEKLRQEWHEAWDVVRHEAAVQLGKIQALTGRVDAAIRRNGRTPAPWPLTAPIAQQTEWAMGKLDPSLKFPGLDGRSGSYGPPKRPSGPPALPPGRAA